MKLVWKKKKEEKFRMGWRKVIKKTFALPNGIVKEFDIKDEGVSAGIFVLTKDKKVVLEKIFRPGPEQVVLEIPGGAVEDGEDPKEAASRELLEETGYQGTLEFAGKTIDDAYSNLIRYIFVAKDCVKVQEPDRSDDEIMELVEMSLDDFRKHIRSGQLTDTELGYIALDYLELL